MPSVVSSSDIKKATTMLESLVEGGGFIESAAKVGITDIARDALPLTIGSKQRKWARDIIAGKIDVEGAPMGYRAMIALLKNPKTPAGQQIEISKFFISHSIAAPKAKEEDGGHEKNPSEMTNEELRQHLAKSDAELTRRMVVVETITAQSIDDVI